MKKTIIISFLCAFICTLTVAQTLTFRSSKDGLELKWYTQQLTYPEGVDVYRKQEGAEWAKLTATPIYPNAYTIPIEKLQQDTVLSEMVEVLKEETNPKSRYGLLTVNFMVKSFQSLDFSKRLGIYYHDKSVHPTTSYRYKVVTTKGEEIFRSYAVVPNEIQNTEPPKEFKLKRTGKQVNIKWLPETKRYYAVNIYVRYPEQNEFTKRNQLPITVSEEANYFFGETVEKKKGTYRYKLQAIDLWGELSEFSTVQKFTIKNSELAEPAYGFKADTIMNNTVQFSWQHNHADQIQGYKLYHKTSIDHEWKAFDTTIISKDRQELELMNIPAGDHYFSISAMNADNYPNHSNLSLVVIEDIEAPDVITGLTGKLDKRKVKLSWQASKAQDLESYLIYRSFNDKDYLLLNPNGVNRNTFEQTIDKRVTASIWYKVVARDSSLNNSEYSQSVKLTVKDETPPQTPMIKTIKVGHTKAEVIWLANAEPDLAHYSIQRCHEGSCELLKDNLKASSYLDSGFVEQEKMSVSYQVQATDASGNKSNFSKPFEVVVFKQSIVKETIWLKVKKKGNKHHKVTWKKIKNEPVVLKLVLMKPDGTKQEYKVSSKETKKKIKEELTAIHLKAYYKNGQIITSNTWTP